jgi:hypothetical protein
VIDAVFLEGEPREIADSLRLDGRNYTFTIPEDDVPLNATEVELLSFFFTSTTENAPLHMFVRTSTYRNGRMYPFYQRVVVWRGSDLAYLSARDWYPIGSVPIERNVTFGSSGKPGVKANASVYVTGYRV